MKPHFWDEICEGDAALLAKGWWVDQMMRDEIVFEQRSGKISPLRILFEYWAENQRGVFRPMTDLSIPVQAVDVSTEWPFAYKWVRHNANTFGSLSGQVVGDVEHPALVRMVAQHYMLGKHCPKPLYHRLEQEFHDKSREYTRLMLPPINGIIYYAFRSISLVRRHAEA